LKSSQGSRLQPPLCTAYKFDFLRASTPTRIAQNFQGRDKRFVPRTISFPRGRLNSHAAEWIVQTANTPCLRFPRVISAAANRIADEPGTKCKQVAIAIASHVIEHFLNHIRRLPAVPNPPSVPSIGTVCPRTSCAIA